MKKSVKQKKARKIWIKPLIKKRTNLLFAQSSSICNATFDPDCSIVSG